MEICPTVELVDHMSIDEVVSAKIEFLSKSSNENAFYVVDFGDIVKKFNIWQKVFPRIEPFYAVKCNDDTNVIRLLASLGTGFDCASQVEIQKVLSTGVAVDRIIYANPCKQSNFLRYSEKVGVDLMTFDNELELQKIKTCFPDARLVLRILPPSTDKVQCELGNKFGCHPKLAGPLLQKARELQLNVVGVSFHVGSGCYDAEAFSIAVQQSKMVFEMAEAYGYSLDLLDVGGGFPGTPDAKITIEEIGVAMNRALDEHFPEGCGVRIISEPGRFFVASAFTLTVNVIGKRVVARDMMLGDGAEITANDEPSFMYYVNDGVYGSFNCMLYDHADITVKVPAAYDHDGFRFTSSIWGPTCDGLDCIKEMCSLPQLNVGDWITFPNMGAYTLAAGSPFNGMPPPEVYYIAKINSNKSPTSVKFSPGVCRLYEPLLPCHPDPSLLQCSVGSALHGPTEY